MGRPRRASWPRRHHAEQLPLQPPPDVPVRRSHRSPQLRVQVCQGLRRRNPQEQVLGGKCPLVPTVTFINKSVAIREIVFGIFTTEPERFQMLGL